MDEKFGTVDDLLQVEVVAGPEERRRVQRRFRGKFDAKHLVAESPVVRILVTVQSPSAINE